MFNLLLPCSAVAQHSSGGSGDTEVSTGGSLWHCLPSDDATRGIYVPGWANGDVKFNPAVRITVYNFCICFFSPLEADFKELGWLNSAVCNRSPRCSFTLVWGQFRFFLIIDNILYYICIYIYIYAYIICVYIYIVRSRQVLVIVRDHDRTESGPQPSASSSSSMMIGVLLRRNHVSHDQWTWRERPCMNMPKNITDCTCL